MVIPVCFKCQSGVEVIRYHCPECNHAMGSFLLGYVEPVVNKAEAVAQPEVAQSEEESIQRAQYFEDTNKHYKLRAKMQGLLELRANTDGRRQGQPPVKPSKTS